MRSCPNDDAVAYKMQQAIALDGLHFDLLYKEDKELANRITNVMKDVASATVEGKDTPALKWKDGLDEDAQRMYLESINDLLKLISDELHES